MTSSSISHGVLAVLVIVAGGVGLEVAYGARVGDVLLYLAYEVGFVVLPGWLVYRALSNRPGGPLRQLALGWALGYVLEILAFVLTAATDTRGLVVLYPPVAVVAAMVLVRRRRHRSRRSRSVEPEARVTARFVWALAAVCLGAVGFVGVAFFESTPLPGTESVRYAQDVPWAISIAAEAKHHWPVEDPGVSGEPFPYHYFVHLHWASASQVTGIDLSLIFFGLWILPLVVLLVLQFVIAGQSLARSRQAGLIAACLAIFVGQLQLDISDVDGPHYFTEQLPFMGVFFSYLVSSPSFLLGLALFLPLVILIGERITAEDDVSDRSGWLLVALFAIGASDAKIVVLPLMAGGLVGFAAWCWVTRHRVARAVWSALGLTLAVLGVVYLVQYRGHSSGLRVDPGVGFDYFTQMPLVSLLRTELADLLPGFPGQSGLLATFAFVFGASGLLLAPLVGLGWILRRPGRHLEATEAWLLAILGAGLAALLMVTSIAGNQLYFFFTAVTVGCLLSGQGLWMAWQTRPPLAGQRVPLAALGGAAALLIAGLVLAPTQLDLFQGADREPQKYFFLFGGLLVGLCLLYFAARRWAGPPRWAAAAILCGTIIAVGALDIPVKRLAPALEASDPPEEGKRMTPELHEALTWIRHETPPDTVIAVNNQMTDLGPYEFTYGAFSERRVFLQGWGYSARSVLRTSTDQSFSSKPEDNPYADRLTLNEAVFAHPTLDTLRALAERYGVRYLVVDKINGSAADLTALASLTTLVYEAAGVSVFALGEPSAA